MSTRRFYIRLILEILGIIALTEAAVMFVLPVVAPGADWYLRAVLDTALLSLIAGPLIAWRVRGRSDEAKQRTGPHRAPRRPLAASMVALACGLLITGLSARWVWNATERDAWQRFDLLAERVRGAAARRMNIFTYGLKGCRGLFLGSKSVERAEFREYAQSRSLTEEFVGAMGLGFIERVPRARLDEWTAATRADGFPEFTVNSTGDGPDLYIVKFLEPVETNAQALGLDVATDPVRKEAIDRAMRTGEPVVTGSVTFVQDPRYKHGLLYVLPVYEAGSSPQSDEDRLASCIGCVYYPIVMERALSGVTNPENDQIDIEVFDGAIASADTMIYDDDGTFSRDARVPPRFERDSPLRLGGRQWTLHITGRPAFDRTTRPVQAMAVAAGGLLMSLLLGGLVWVMTTARARALSLAMDMTSELTAAKEGAELTLREQAESLALTATLARAEDVHAAVAAVMASIVKATGLDRCAVLLFPGKDGDGVCRFVGSLGLSLTYQAAVNGHCPWREGQAEARPILFEDVASEPSLAQYRDLFAREAIGSAAFIPVMTDEGVAGKLMLYHARVGAITPRMLDGALVAGGFLGVTIARIRAQAQTRDSENLFRLLVEGGDDFVNLMSTDSKALYVSPSYFRLTGWTAQDLRESDFTTRVHPDDLKAVLAARKANLAGKPTRLEYRAKKKDGTFLWLDLRATPVLDDAGAMVNRILCFSRDITESKQVEQRIRESEQRLEQAVRGSRDGLWDIDHATGATWRSDRLLEMMGYTRGELPATVTSWRERLHPDDRAGAVAMLADHAQRNVPFDAEIRMHCKSGEYRWFRIRGEAVRDAQGCALRSSGSMCDIHDRKQAEQRLEASERRMRAIIDGTDVVAWEYDFAVGRFTYVSPQAARFGYPLDDWMVPGFWQGHIHPEDRDAIVTHCREESMAGRNHRFQYRFVKADGETAWVDDFVSVEMRGAEVATLRGVLIDITESRRLQNMAEAANAAKSEFLANMSHEIRTPLTAILGYTELLVEDGDLSQAPRRRVENLSTIKRAGEHLLTVVNDILDLSKIEAGRLEVEEVESDLPGVLGEVGSLMGARAKEKGIALQIKLGTLLPMKAMTDPTRLRQILLNLVGNAVKFTDQGKVEVTASVADSVLYVDIEDTGPGMSESQVERLFVPFAQADTSVTRKHGGTGLGLTICRRLAALMGGSVTLHRTSPGCGSTFRVTLPLSVPAGTQWTQKLHMVTETAQAPAPMALSGRILLAEDGEDNQRLIAFHLKKAGAQVDIAENGRIALDMIENAGDGGYDILLTDMQMPVVDGYTLARTLRERGSRIPIIALTAHAMAEDRRKCLDAGCDDYASKPIDRVALLTTCAAWIGKQGGQNTRLAA